MGFHVLLLLFIYLFIHSSPASRLLQTVSWTRALGHTRGADGPRSGAKGGNDQRDAPGVTGLSVFMCVCVCVCVCRNYNNHSNLQATHDRTRVSCAKAEAGVSDNHMFTITHTHTHTHTHAVHKLFCTSLIVRVRFPFLIFRVYFDVDTMDKVIKFLSFTKCSSTATFTFLESLRIEGMHYSVCVCVWCVCLCVCVFFWGLVYITHSDPLSHMDTLLHMYVHTHT